MKKHFKYLATAGLIAALLLAAGCGDDAKDKKKVDKPDIKTEQKVDKKAQAPVVKPPEGKYYRYPSYLDDVTKTPEMTPEMIKYVDDFASTVKLAPSEKVNSLMIHALIDLMKNIIVSGCMPMAAIIIAITNLKILRGRKYISRRFIISVCL